MTAAPVKVISTDRVSSITANIRALGQLTGHASRADALALGLEKKISLYARKAGKNLHPPSVFYYLWNDPLMTAGGGSYIDDLIRLAGGKNVAGGKKNLYPIYSWERLMLDDPEVIFGPSNLAKELRALGEKHELRAARKRRIYALDADVLSRPGPRVVEALEKLSLVLKKR
jgi:iron complex transport system substrate-binding protein